MQRQHAGHLITGIRRYYASEPGSWAIFTEVRSHTGSSDAAPTYADALARSTIRVRGAYLTDYLECKVSRQDFLSELAHPDKAAAIGRFCDRRILCVAAPWKRIVHAFTELPAGWGLLEIGTGEPTMVRESCLFDVVPWTDEFLASVLRSAAESREAEEDKAANLGAPMVVVQAFDRRRGVLILSCPHTVPHSRKEAIPQRVRCLACGAGEPATTEGVDAAIGAMSIADLEAHHEYVGRQLLLKRHEADNPVPVAPMRRRAKPLGRRRISGVGA